MGELAPRRLSPTCGMHVAPVPYGLGLPGMGRLADYLRRPDVRAHPARALARRAWFEIERVLAPGRAHHERMVRLPAGPLMRVRTDDVIERAIWLYGYHEFRYAEIFSMLVDSGATVIDAGAHAGQYTLIAAARGARVIAIEPNPGVRARLEANVSLNALTNVVVVDRALADTDAPVTLRIPLDRGDNSGIASVTFTGPASEIAVEGERLDTLVARLGAADVALIKLDVEGAEDAAISGATGTLERSHPTLMFEADDLRFGRPKALHLSETLAMLGYRLYAVPPRAPTPMLVPADLGDLARHTPTASALNLFAVHPAREGRLEGLLAR